eukprot:TRINITY_DN2076_c0_g1_i1.p1 TRINITY_DN2076_c0_g1~~TRINITY_DN2076_c0_g1_i1.p1  ORF type:complete len:170 (+),score=31.32 TRINITY_DN2076_c0_g1_i1:384-893(+)
MILEYCKFGSLTSHFGKNTLSKALKRMIALDCAKGMQFLHNNKFIHRDLKTDNLLLISLSVSTPIRAKVSDFGTSRMISDESKQSMTIAIGTPSFMSPESIDRGSEYSLPSDVFSFAMALLFLLFFNDYFFTRSLEPLDRNRTVFSPFSIHDIPITHITHNTHINDSFT